VDKHRLDQAWDDDVQRERSLDSLLVDGLVEPLAGALYTLAT
jgi:A/G-specific adenine glycosylase